MDTLNNELLKLSCFEQETLLRKLAEYAQVVQNLEKLPVIHVALSSGQIVNGRIVKYDPSSRNMTIVVTADNATHAQATFINLIHVVAISIANITQHAHHFSDGRIAVPVYYEKITKLGFRRTLSEIAEKINASNGLSITIDTEFDAGLYESDLANYTIKTFADIIEGTLLKVAEDPLGVESLKDKVKEIRLGQMENPTVELNGDGVLQISIHPEKGESGSFRVETLQAAIEDQL